MRNDLLDAQASVDWAVSNLPFLDQRLTEWLKQNVRVIIKELDPENPNDLVVAKELEFLPLSFNVEAGAYINAIRSSLDLLATALAVRYSIPMEATPFYSPCMAALAVVETDRRIAFAREPLEAWLPTNPAPPVTRMFFIDYAFRPAPPTPGSSRPNGLRFLLGPGHA
jgi:hypothetical protein